MGSELVGDVLRTADRATRKFTDKNESSACCVENLIPPHCFVFKNNAHSGHQWNACPNDDFIIVACGFDVVNGKVGHRKQYALILEVPVPNPQVAQGFYASYFEEHRVITVVHIAHPVRFGVPDPAGHIEFDHAESLG